MRELVGRLTSLDPDASESLKVVAYFDELITGGVGIPSLLKGAAFLAGAVAGAETPTRTLRMNATGEAPTAATPSADWPERRTAGGRVWIERTGAANINDAMILERLTVALEVLASKRLLTPENSVAVAVDPARSAADRIAALDRLRVTADTRARLVITFSDVEIEAARTTIYPTATGLVRVAIDTTGTLDVRRAGIGLWARADHLPDTLAAAVAAFRLTDERYAVINASGLGSLLPIVLDAIESGHADQDVIAVRSLNARERIIADALVEHDSIRAAAAALGLHHSSVHARHNEIAEKLGWDPRSVAGRMRYLIAGMCLRIRAQ